MGQGGGGYLHEHDGSHSVDHMAGDPWEGTQDNEVEASEVVEGGAWAHMDTLGGDHRKSDAGDCPGVGGPGVAGLELPASAGGDETP